MSYQFPSDFKWGVATAAYQIEGAASEDGRKPSVWDTFSRVPGAVRTGDTGDTACDHYHLYEKDIALMASLGVKHYRCSLAWPRIIPDGTGSVNEKGLDFYKRLFDCCEKHGITPHVTLFHWDSPQALQDKYGSWLSRQMAYDFAEYVAVCVKSLGDRVQNWMTINEIPCFTTMGYNAGPLYQGMHAPGMVVGSQKEVWQTVYHAALGHGLAVQAIRANSPHACRVSLVDNTCTPVPVSESEANIEAAKKAYGALGGNGAIIYPILTGKFSEAFLRAQGAKNALPDIRDEDLNIMSQPIDGLGLNIYSGTYVRAADNEQGFEELTLPINYPHHELDWLNHVPDSIYWAARLPREVLEFDGYFFVSENGCAAPDTVGINGEVNDLTRVLYLRNYLRQVFRAVAEGLPVRGYFLWSFLDNFEWSWGYSRRFGIVYTNYDTQERIPKTSAKWYAECIRQNRVV